MLLEGRIDDVLVPDSCEIRGDSLGRCTILEKGILATIAV